MNDRFDALGNGQFALATAMESLEKIPDCRDILNLLKLRYSIASVERDFDRKMVIFHSLKP